MLKCCVCRVCLCTDVFVQMWCVYIYRYDAEVTEGCQVSYFIIILPHSLRQGSLMEPETGVVASNAQRFSCVHP